LGSTINVNYDKIQCGKEYAKNERLYQIIRKKKQYKSVWFSLDAAEQVRAWKKQGWIVLALDTDKMLLKPLKKTFALKKRYVRYSQVETKKLRIMW